MSRLAASIGLAFALALGLGGGEVAAQAQSDGQLTVAFDVSIALTFLDPAETESACRSSSCTPCTTR